MPTLHNGSKEREDAVNTIRMLQVNRRWGAMDHDLLPQFAAEVKADIVLMGEKYRDKDPVLWHFGLSNIAVIWVRDQTRLRILAQGRGVFFV